MNSLLKSTVAALSLATTFAVCAEEVISLNFVDLRNDQEANTTITDNNPHGMRPVPGSAWDNLRSDGNPDVGGWDTSVSGVTLYDTDTRQALKADDITVTWHCWKTYRWNTYGDAQKEMRGWLDDAQTYIEITLDNVPFKTYDAYVYFCSDNAGYKYTPVSFTGENGTFYTWDDNTGMARVANNAQDNYSA